MKRLTSIEGILDFVIAGEIKAHELYMEIAAMVESPWIRKTLEGLAQEEVQHRAKLEAVKASPPAVGQQDSLETCQS